MHMGSLVVRESGATPASGSRVDYYLRHSNDFYYDNQDRWAAGLFVTYDF